MGEVKILEQKETGETDAPHVSKWLTYIIEGMILLLGLVLVVLLRINVYEPAYIPSASMENTLQNGDRVIIDHRKNLRGKWKRGDVILFEANENWGGGEETLIKRIVGLPGETVEMNNGQIYINGKLLAEDYLKETPLPEEVRRFVLPKGQYYVLGDNRKNSDDSRYNGPVNEEDIRGRAVMVFYPLGRFGRLPQPGYDK